MQVLSQFRLRCLLSTVALLLTLNGMSHVSAQGTTYESLFNGKDLAGWKGDARFWRVENGAIVGETTADNQAEHNTFLIYTREEFDDFELRFAYKVKGYNSGVQYRSEERDDYVVHGYQADFEAQWHEGGTLDKYSGMFFEEGGRMFLGQRGEAVIVRTNANNPKQPLIEKVGQIGKSARLAEAIDRDGWNQYTVIARGFQFTHIINGQIMAIGWDEDRASRRRQGIIAFQLHSGPPMQIQVKDVRVRRLGEENENDLSDER